MKIIKRNYWFHKRMYEEGYYICNFYFDDNTKVESIVYKEEVHPELSYEQIPTEEQQNEKKDMILNIAEQKVIKYKETEEENSKGLMLFKAEDAFYINNRGWIYNGLNPYPFTIDKYKERNWEKKYFLNKEWLIAHPNLSKEKTYKVIGIETFAIMEIRPNDTIGLLIKERQNNSSK